MSHILTKLYPALLQEGQRAHGVCTQLQTILLMQGAMVMLKIRKVRDSHASGEVCGDSCLFTVSTLEHVCKTVLLHSYRFV